MSNGAKKVLLGILSFLFPLIGLILWLAKKSSDKEVANTCGIAALAGFVINAIIILAA